MPQKLNLIHQFAYDDNSSGLQYAFMIGMKYQPDNRKKSPMELAMSRNSFDCTDVILTNIFKDEAIVRNLKVEEVAQMISFSPSKLFLFFDNAVREEDIGLPNFGKI